MKKCLHVLFMIAALSLTFTACAGQVDEEADEKEEKTEKVTEPESPSPETQTPAAQNPEGQGQGQGQNPEDPEQGQGQGQGGTEDPNGQQQNPAPVFNRFELKKITIVRTDDLLTDPHETALDDFIKKPIAEHVKPNAELHPYYVNCKIEFGENSFPGKVKVRGNWTTSYPKKSLRIKLDDAHNILGLHDGKDFKNWVLLAGYKDASFLRDAAGFTMFKTMFPDYYSSDFRLVEVSLKTKKTGSEDEYNEENLGIYLLAEQQEVKENRIDIKEAKKKESENTNIGYLIEFDNYASNEEDKQWFRINYLNNNEKLLTYTGKEAGGLITDYTIKNDMYSETQRDFIKNYMANLWRICYEAAYNNTYYKFDNGTLVSYDPEGDDYYEKAKNCVAEVIDLVSLANTYIFSEITCDPDLYYSSFYMDIDFSKGDHKLRFEAPWDFDSTMGNKRFCSISEDNFYTDPSMTKRFTINSMYAGDGQPDVNGDYSTDWDPTIKIRVNPWLVVFIRSAWFQDIVKEQWKNIGISNLKSEVTTVIDNYTNSTEYAEAFAKTRKKWSWYKDGELNEATLAAANASQTAAAEYLKNWLIARIDAVNNIITNLQPQNN